MMQALRGEPMTIYGDGSQTRSFCYVDDLIEGILRLSRSDEHLPVNIGNPDEFTILECAQAVLEVTGSKSELRFEALPEDDPTRRCPDIAKARALLGWEPKIKLREGLQRSLEFFRSKVLRPAGKPWTSIIRRPAIFRRECSLPRFPPSLCYSFPIMKRTALPAPDRLVLLGPACPPPRRSFCPRPSSSRARRSTPTRSCWPPRG